MSYKIGSLSINKIALYSVLSILLTLLFCFKLGGFDKVHKNNVKLSEENKKYVQTIKENEKALEELTKELDEYKTEEKKEKDIKLLKEAKEEFDAQNYAKAYDLIKDIKVDLLSDENKAVYNELKPYLIKEVGKQYYNKGKELFENEKY